MRANNRVLLLPLLAAGMMQGFAQQQGSAQSPSSSGSQTGTQSSSSSSTSTTSTPPSSTSSTSATTAQPTAQTQPKPAMPYFLPDGGFSIEPFYWRAPALPVMRGGAQALASDAGLDYTGLAKNPYGVEMGIPAGEQSTIRVSYFRTQGFGNQNLQQNATLIGTILSPGDYVETNDVIQDMKVSYDYLTWPVTRGPRKVRVKTLWEMQWLSFGTHITAPFAPVNANSASGNYAATTKNLFLPTFGAELEEAASRHFRWELKGDGFAIPHHGVIWEGEGSLCFRVGHVELMAGGKAFHFKTSPQSDEYFFETLWGPYAGLRYYFTRTE